MAPGAAGDAARAKLGVKPETTIGELYAMAQDAFDAMTPSERLVDEIEAESDLKKFGGGN